MELLLDLHVHSRFRAVSADMDLNTCISGPQRKGIDIRPLAMSSIQRGRPRCRPNWSPLTTAWATVFYELDPGLREPLDQAISRSCRQRCMILSGEISHIFKRRRRPQGSQPKSSCSPYAPIKVADRLRLNNRSGRSWPVWNCYDAATIWFGRAHLTPHFRSLARSRALTVCPTCFGDLTPHIFALETGLSSDPTMNWRLSALTFLACPARTRTRRSSGLPTLDIPSPPTFADVRRALEVCSPDEFLGTIEFFPEEGKYHLDGHRDCGVRLEPGERAALAGLCPRCKPVTVGVLSRAGWLTVRKTTPIVRHGLS